MITAMGRIDKASRSEELNPCAKHDRHMSASCGHIAHFVGVADRLEPIALITDQSHSGS
jgi:hypothetical protein